MTSDKEGVMRPKGMLLVCFILLAAATHVWAQATATIVGTVTDANGTAVPNASITVTQKETGLARRVTTNDRGVYVAPSLPVGTYSVMAEMSGFKRKTLTGIVLQVNEEPRIDLELEVGEVSETIIVTSQASLLQAENASVGQVIDNRYTTQIPLNG